MKTFAPQLCSQADLFRTMGRKIAEDCIKAGWLKPRVERQGEAGRPFRVYAVEDMRRCELRILEGEYPS